MTDPLEKFGRGIGRKRLCETIAKPEIRRKLAADRTGWRNQKSGCWSSSNGILDASNRLHAYAAVRDSQEKWKRWDVMPSKTTIHL